MRAGDLPIGIDTLDEAHATVILAARQAAYAHPPGTAAQATRLVLCWALGEELYATPLDDIAAVAPLPPVTRVPGAPPALAGVFSRHGMVYNLFDPASLLGAKSASGPVRHALVLRGERPSVALGVTDVRGVLAIEEYGLHDGLTRFVAPPDEAPFALVSTALLVERLLARHGPGEG